MGNIIESSFGTKQAKLFRLTNKNGMQLSLTNFGARIVEVNIPIDGHLRNVSLAASSDTEYLEQDTYVGATVAPVVGRISGAKTVIKGETVHFTENEPGKTLHSGEDISTVQYWGSEVDETNNQVRFHLSLADGHNGFPGPVSLTATFTLTDENEVKVDFKAQSEKDTVFNPTNHVYFNLSGDFFHSVADHQLKIHADRYVPLGEGNLPTGEFASVVGTPFDFREFAPLAQGLESDFEQNVLVGGYDHPWELKDVDVPVEVISPDEKIRLLMRSNQPAVVIYTYNHGPEGLAEKHGAFSLECQGFPDACNLDGFCSILLEEGETYESSFSYQFLF
ncbi:aldose epimerase family protein [Streptococcus cameli]